ncbi:MAG: endonuclease/exonuclease/phosphatase family protein, partial [Betaproteobacteria bacterium]|nr:endonuclease/exonuclease/phosphatase family protein [Betaproteobacteria bacterium]
MIGRIEVFVRRLRRWFSRSEWLARLLGLPSSIGTETAPGLVMIQVDGLSQAELERALDMGEMPFLRRLINREQYRLHRHYAGVPSTTAAFQGELFYGVKAIVPGFNFMERATGRLVRMFEPAIAARVERKLEDQGGEPLLRDGSLFVGHYTGGAAEPHFCSSSQGWGPTLREAHPAAVAVLILSNAFSFVRAAVLLVVELLLAVADCVGGIIEGRNIVEELKLVPSRVVIGILLRELATIGAKIDVARGVPVIQINFLGYDEQAHRRGPASRFAHWTLQGIDDAIERVWHAAHLSARRHYDVWIYSDHGQMETQSYDKIHGRSFARAVADVLTHFEGRAIEVRSSGSRGVQLQRVRLLGGKRIQRLLPAGDLDHDEPDDSRLAVAPLGPLAMVYYDRALGRTERAAFARLLQDRAKIPLVLTKEGTDRARAWTDACEYVLPKDSARLLGADHPFLEEVTFDLIALCHHPDAGEFIACGWRAATSAMSFAIENGAHGGPAPEETNAFALLPADAPLPSNDCDYIRPSDLRHAAFHFLGRSETKASRAPRRYVASRDTLRIMTYNVHSCVGMDGKLLPERIARIIDRYAPDIAALQELDVGRERTAFMDQAHIIARHLEMDFHFHPAMHLEEERYGDAILTHLPMRLVNAGALPTLPGKRYLEPRGALWVAVDVYGREFQVINTHLGLLPRERTVQIEALLGTEWLAHPDCRGPVILCGDLNARPASPVCRRL